MREPKSVTDLLTSRLLRLSNTLGLYSHRRYRKEFGVTLPEWRVMSIIALNETSSTIEVSRILVTDKAWVGLTVTSLAKRGYVKRTADKQDSRRTLLRLTEQGREVHDAIMANAKRRQRRLLAALPDGTADTLSACIDRLQAEADQMLEELDTAQSEGSPTK